MSSPNNIKRENIDDEVPSSVSPNNGNAFDKYIHTDYLDDNTMNISNIINQDPNGNEIQNQEMVDLFINSLFIPEPTLNQNLIQPNFFSLDNSALPPIVEDMTAQMDAGSPGTTATFDSEFNGSSRTKKDKSKYGDNCHIRADLILSPEDQEQIEKAGPKERRQIRNKISARNFRLRRKEYINGLEDKVKMYDENISALHQELANKQKENISLQIDIEDLRQKFELLTAQTPSLQHLSGIDPSRDLTIYQGQLVTMDSIKESIQTNRFSCRDLSGIEVNKQGDVIGDNKLGNRFQASNGQSYMVKA